MNPTIISIVYLVLFIPGIFLFYYLLQCFDYEKIIKRGKSGYFKALYILVCIVLSFLVASAVVTLMNYVSNFFS